MTRFTQWGKMGGFDWFGFGLTYYKGDANVAIAEAVAWATEQFGKPGDPELSPEGQRWIHRYESFIFTDWADAMLFKAWWG